MVAILPLLLCLLPELTMTTLRQFSRIALALLSMTGRVSMLGISRWAGEGGSYRNPVLFSILWENGLIEGVGQGLDTVVTVLAREQMEPPHFEDINHAFFVARVMGRPLETFHASDIYSRLSDRQRRILAIIRARGEASSNDIAAGLGGQVTQRSIQRDVKTLLTIAGHRTQTGCTLPCMMSELKF
jgi:putative transposase